MPAKNDNQPEEVIGGGFRPRPLTDAMRERHEGYESEKTPETRAAEQPAAQPAPSSPPATEEKATS